MPMCKVFLQLLGRIQSCAGWWGENYIKIGFRNEGIVYEYEEFAANKNDMAVKLWEKGIEVDPNHSSNYYFFTKQYTLKEILSGACCTQNVWILESFNGQKYWMKTLTNIKVFLLSFHVPPKVTDKRGIDKKKADRRFCPVYHSGSWNTY